MILVIASDRGPAAVLEHVLELAGHGPIESADPAHALEAVAAGQPRLVLLDLDHPEADGVDVLATLAPFIPASPVIAMAAAGAAAGLAGVMLSRGSDLVLPKGTSFEMVLDRDVRYKPAEIP